MGGRRSSLRPTFSNVFSDPVSGADVILLGTPIIGAGNEFKGMLAGKADIRTSLLSAPFAQVLELKAGRTGFAYLVDGNGRVIYHRQSAEVGKDLSASGPVTRAIGGETDAIVTEDSAGRSVISGFAPVPGTDWSVVTSERWENVVGPLQDWNRWFLVLLAIVGLLAAGLIFYGMGRILRPIKDLTRGAQRIAGGDFDHTITARTGDEIQALAQQFNTMAGALKESYADLEQKVADRTQEVRESEEKYRSLFEDSRDAIFIAHDNKVLDANQAALDLFGFTRDEAVGSDVLERYVDPAEGHKFGKEIDTFGYVRDFEVKLRKNDGTEMDCLMTATRRWAEDKSNLGVQGVIRDVTERKQAEEALFQQGRELAVLEERNRMAREIHDTLAQGFTGIVLQLEAAEQALEDHRDEVPDHLGRAKGLARDSLQEARRSVWGLLPGALEERSLDAALREEVQRFAATGREKAPFTVSGARRDLPSNIQAALLRICQESLTNARRHAQAAEVRVELTFHPDAVSLAIQDNGIGLDFDAVNARDRRSGFGLAGMQERARLLGGTLSATGQKGKGTLVEARIPTP